MNRFSLLLVFVFTVVSLSAQNTTNAVGSAVENQLLLADPCVLEDDGWYYIYGTHSDSGIVVYRSRDMRHWSDLCGNAKEGLALHKDDVWGEKWFWAPEVYKIGDKYFMTYSAEEHICYAESDSPCGPFVQRDKRPYLPNEKGIDSHIFFEKGRAYIFWVRFDGPYGIWMAELTSDLHALKMETARLIFEPLPDSWEHVQAHVSEGPAITKYKGKYYMTYSCNDYQSKDYAVGVAVADRLEGPYERHPDNPILHRFKGYVGTGHHTIMPTPAGLYMVYHAHYSHQSIHPRQTLISPIRFVRDKQWGKGRYTLQVGDELIIPKTK